MTKSITENGEEPKPKNLTLQKRWSENPFVLPNTEYARGKKRVVVKGNKAIVDVDSGEYENTAEITATKTVDAETFVKIFPGKIGQIMALRPGTQKIFAVVLRALGEAGGGSDTVMLNEKIISSKMEEIYKGEKPPSKATIFRALSEMCSKNLLARSDLDTSLYYINLNVFFNGDRIKFVEEWHIQKQEKLFDEQTVEYRQGKQIDVEAYIADQKNQESGNE